MDLAAYSAGALFMIQGKEGKSVKEAEEEEAEDGPYWGKGVYYYSSRASCNFDGNSHGEEGEDPQIGQQKVVHVIWRRRKWEMEELRGTERKEQKRI